MSLTINTITTPVSTLVLSNTPREIYKSPHSQHVIRLGNGGAGPSGLLRALAEDYQDKVQDASTIEWYQNISPLTLRALRDGTLDIALTYERDQEDLAIAQGWAEGPTLIFNDHFVVVGPATNPAGLDVTDSPVEAFTKLASFAKRYPASPLFLSRNDNSATSLKERLIWKAIGVDLTSKNFPDWYLCDSVFPAAALLRADRQGLYTLTDHGTFAMLSKEMISTKLFSIGGDLLRNPCNALLRCRADAETRRFLEYLGKDGQQVVHHFGTNLYGRILYTPADILDLSYT